MPSLAWIHLMVAKFKHVNTRILHSHNNQCEKTLKGRFKGFLIKLSPYFATHYFACSKEAGEFLFKRKKFRIINNGIDVDRFLYNQNIRQKIRKEWELENKIIIGHVGRFVQSKNHDFLLDIYKRLKQKNSQFALVMIGDGPLRGKIEERINEDNIKDTLIIPPTKNIEQLYQAMDLFVFPSLFEGLGIVLIEAQSSGLFCLTSKYNVPDAVSVTSRIEKISLTEGVEKWISAISNFDQSYNREKIDLSELRNSFDIKQVAKKMQLFYMERYERYKYENSNN